MLRDCAVAHAEAAHAAHGVAHGAGNDLDLRAAAEHGVNPSKSRPSHEALTAHATPCRLCWWQKARSGATSHLLGLEAEVLARAAAVGAQHAKGVGLVHKQAVPMRRPLWQ